MATRRVSLALLATACALLLSTVAQVQAKTIQVGGPYRLSPWGPLTIKWKCPPIEVGDKLGECGAERVRAVQRGQVRCGEAECGAERLNAVQTG
ncbi:unnamed protein product [Closterium sp. NIES-54]